MIEYHMHIAGVDASRQALYAAAQDANVAERANGLAAAIEQHRELAWLGSVIDALVFHAGSETETVLLSKCAKAWSKAVALYDELKTARIEFELALLRDDIENPVQVAQMGFDRLVRAQHASSAMLAELKGLQEEVATAPHLPSHARQADKPSSEWLAGDAFLGRRSLAFVQAMLARAGDSRGLALAAGAVAGLAGNVAGSAYLAHAVGGPRRLHRFRDRLARNTLGAWAHAQKETPASGEIASEILRGASAPGGDREELAPDLAAQIASAFADAYPTRPPIDVPNAFKRMIEHLSLLEAFGLPALPESPPLIEPAGGGLMPIETGSQGDIQPLDASQGGQPLGPLEPIPAPPGDTGQDKSSTPKGGCGALAFLAALLVAALVYLIWCIVRATEDKNCDPGDLLDDLVGDDDTVEAELEVDEAKLALMRKPERASHLFQEIYQTQLTYWQALEAAKRALIVNGLIYPETNDLGLKLHKQFLDAFSVGGWPRRGSPATDEAPQAYPMTPTEEPQAPSPFPNHGPVLLFAAELNEPTIAAATRAALLALADLTRLEGHGNPDLDADRGWRHLCWGLVPGGSIVDVPLTVAILPYGSE
jgi:hypothetical protein